MQLEAEIERDQIVRRDHHHHAKGGEQEQYRVLEARDLLALDVTKRHHHREARADEDQHLHELSEGVDDEEIAEGALCPPQVVEHQEQREAEHQHREPTDNPGVAVTPEDAEHEEDHGRKGQENLRQGRLEGEKIPTQHASFPRFKAVPVAWRP